MTRSLQSGCVLISQKLWCFPGVGAGEGLGRAKVWWGPLSAHAFPAVVHGLAGWMGLQCRKSRQIAWRKKFDGLAAWGGRFSQFPSSPCHRPRSKTVTNNQLQTALPTSIEIAGAVSSRVHCLNPLAYARGAFLALALVAIAGGIPKPVCIRPSSTTSHHGLLKPCVLSLTDAALVCNTKLSQTIEALDCSRAAAGYEQPRLRQQRILNPFVCDLTNQKTTWHVPTLSCYSDVKTQGKIARSCGRGSAWVPNPELHAALDSERRRSSRTASG